MSNDNCNGKNASVISIVGMGGLGKTTLAQLVYNDQNIKNHFDLQAWVCVSEDFDLQRLNRDIIESATRNGCNLSGLDPMQRSLEDILRGKRFLIVLDDVWNENHNVWDRLRVPFNAGAQGSKIIATTRSDIVSSTMDAIHAYRLEILPDDDCMALFISHAFANGESNAYPNLLEIGEKLVRKCRGLPLAAKSLGGLLSSRRDESYWRSILESEIWNLPVKHDDILPTLKLSYHHLPTHLKQCFAYCSIFPKEYIFQKDELIRLWIASDFISPIKGRCLEEIGSHYFDDLLSRSFFHSDKMEQANSRYKMHDLIHDLAQSSSNGECFRIEHGKKSHILEKARHSSFVYNPDMREIHVEAFEKSMNLRTFMLVHGYNYCFSTTCLNNEVLCDLVARLSFLRVLDLSGSWMMELPDSICNLKHLRYIDLSSTPICRLPESVSSCFNLQILRLKYCHELLQLPKETRKLLNLRHLDLEGCVSLKFTPQGIGKLTCLQTLSKFIVGRESGYGIEELKSLTELRGAISISQLENVEAAIDINMKNKTHIQELVLEWSEEYAERNKEDDQAMKILEVLQPTTNLKELSLKNYGGTSFPSWMLNTMLPNLVRVDLHGCTRCKFLPPLGQLRFLNYLSISKMGQVKHIGREFWGTGEIKGFPSLCTLKILDMGNLVEWCEVEEGELPHLRHLEIRNCPKLMELPILPSTTLDTLWLHSCQQLTTIPLLPSLSQLQLWNCQQLTTIPSLPSLSQLQLWNCQQLTTIPLLPSLRRLRLEKCNEMLLLSVFHLTTLFSLWIGSFPELVSLPEGLFQHLNRLEGLTIGDCQSLISLPEGLFQHLNRLEDLYIFYCQSLISLPELNMLQGTGVFAPIRSLVVESCLNLKSMPEGLRNLTSLEKLYIQHCPHIKSLPEEERPPTLWFLHIGT